MDGKNCILTKEVTDFKSFLMVIDSKLNEIVDQYKKTYLEIVPNYFHSDRVIDEQSSSYDKLVERLESLSVQAILNSLSFSEGSDYLIQTLSQLNIKEKNLYSFKEMFRNKMGILDRLLVVRVGMDVSSYCYYAFYPQVGLKRIEQLDVKILMQNGFKLKEEQNE
jgi:hypothetical protein